MSTGEKIHPTAFVDPTAELGEDVAIGPGAIVGPNVRIGARTRLHAGAIVVGHTTMGADNVLHPGAVVGGDPQDLRFDPEHPGARVIGDGNVFRESVTINRGVSEGSPGGAPGAGATTIGNRGYFMSCSHVGHNAVVGDSAILANSAAIAGHARVGDHCNLSACAAVHQFTTVGDHVFFQGYAAVSMHVPHYVMLSGPNGVVGLNRVGLRRSGRFDDDDLRDIKSLFQLLYRRRAGRTFQECLRDADARSWRPAAERMLEFIRNALAEQPPRRRGICGPLLGLREMRGEVWAKDV